MKAVTIRTIHRSSIMQPAQPVLAEESESLDSLLLELQEGEAERRGRAVLALGESEGEQAVEHIIAALEQDQDPLVRQRAIWALGDVGGYRAIQAVRVAAARDDDHVVRQRAVEALARIAGRRAIEPLTRILRGDPEPFVRYEALVGLAEIGGDRVKGLLRVALADPDELVWAKAAELLHIQPPRSQKR